MHIRSGAAVLLACLALGACSGGMQVGGSDSQLGSSAAPLAEDDPLDNNAINEGTGDIMQ